MLKDYYKILGVLDDAEDIVIKAAYRALAQRYHPDKWVGDPVEATRRMSEINMAYDVLSDQTKRKQYDQGRASNEYGESEEASNDAEAADEFAKSLDDDWKEAVKYFPDLDGTLRNLSNISKLLAQTYKVYLLESKEFEKRGSLATQFERNFLEKYFGANEEIIKFARFLILQNFKNAAKDLNRAVNLLGKNVDSRLIINRILQDHSDVSTAYQSQPPKPGNPSDSHTGTIRPASRMTDTTAAFIFGVIVFLAIVLYALKPEEETKSFSGEPEQTELQKVRSLAERGGAVSQDRVGRMYYDGQGVTQSYQEALKWFRLAAAQGNASAQNSLGVMYADSQGVTQNDQEALKWFRLAAAQGDAGGQNNIGTVYYTGHGVTRNYREAVKWYRLAADQGNAEAQYNIGTMYAEGRGVTQSYQEALKWFRLAAAQGDARAQHSLEFPEMVQAAKSMK